MAAATRDATADLTEAALQGAAGFEFGQLVRLLRRQARRDGLDPDNALRFRPALGLDLPRARVVEAKRSEDGRRYDIATTFLGLYGVASPLPAFYTEDLIDAAQDDRTGAQAFLDLIHQHLYGLYCRAMEKYRPLQLSVEDGRELFRDLLCALVGLRDETLREALPQGDSLLRYIGLLGVRMRSAEGLETLLQAAFALPVDVGQCVQREVRIPPRSRLRLGEQANLLGGNALLGHFVDDATGKIRVTLGPVDGERFNGLINDAEQWRLLVALIRFYVRGPLECELVVRLKPGSLPPARLGERGGNQLGSNSWLHGGDVSEELQARFHLG